MKRNYMFVQLHSGVFFNQELSNTLLNKEIKKKKKVSGWPMNIILIRWQF